ncbi:MAG: transcriptional regulator [Candidatus Komeilibacteria bacterium RIFCSPLOWO2_01_FULL_45_10]|uniref:Transcriptional regulator n=1 Tax=Candidatus Komeilibacteria bacterium RIFCSPLOWO2_01_FULL_45_10 TaxID=1798550 RepID=A0A1G2BKY9_9BACT|nr:MAG: transcriptional regulator [Candidatus Komeilibacteria bacterium RIFCSPLOWO2_01_FULL_45_10]
MESYKNFKNKLLKNRKIKKAYDELGPEFAVIRMIIARRLASGLTQAQLAEKLGTKQSAISRLEQGSYNPSLALLVKLSKALDAKLEISIS